MEKNFSTKKFKLLYQIFGMFLLCLGLVSLFSRSTIAWFKDESITSNGEPNITLVGTLELDVTTNFNYYNLALEPDTIYLTDANNADIATYIKTANNHDIDGAYVRIKFENKRTNVGANSTTENSDLLNLYFNGNLTTATTYSSDAKNKWFYNSEDEYYYYIGGVYETNILFNSGYRTTNYFTNVEAGANVELTFTIESIQRQYGAYLEVWMTAPAVFAGFAAQDTEVHLQS